MKKILALVIVVFNIFQLQSQTIQIGQEARYIKNIIKRYTDIQSRPDSYGNYSTVKTSCDVVYNNGEIVEVVQYFENQYYIDFQKILSGSKHFKMQDGKLALILTQFKNLSKERLINVYDGLYEEGKIGNLYFDENFKYYSKIYLGENDIATVELRKVNLDLIPPNIRNIIKTKQVAIDRRNKELLLEEEREENKRREITSKVYDLFMYDKETYDSFVSLLKQNIKRYYKNSKSFDWYLQKGENVNLKNTYKAYYKLEDHSRPNQYYGNVLMVGSKNVRQVKQILNVSGEDKNCNFYNDLKAKLPTLNIEGYEVMTEATIENIYIEFAKGRVEIKIKNGLVEFKSIPPENEMQVRLIEKVKNEKKGKYILEYEYLDVMGENNLDVRLIKR